MNPFQSEATCDVCGELAKCTAETAAAAWDPRSRVCHSDPQVCADNIIRNLEKVTEGLNKYKYGVTVQYKGETAIVHSSSVSGKPKPKLRIKILRLSGEVKEISPEELDK